MFDTKSIILLTSAIINLSVFFFLIFTKTRTPVKSKKYLALTTLFVSLWMFASWVNHFTPSPSVVAIFSRISYASAIWAIIGFALFGFNYNYVRRNNIFIFLFGVIASLLILLTDKIVKEGIPYNPPVQENVTFGEWYWLFSIILGVISLFTIIILIKTVSVSKGIEKAKILSIIGFFLISILVTLIFNLVFPNLGNTDFIYLGQYSTLIFAIGSAWIVIQEKIYSVRYILSNFLSILTTGLVLFVISWSVTRLELFVFKWDVASLLDTRVIAFGIITASLVAIFVGKLLPFFKDFYYKIFKLSIKDIDFIIQNFIDATNRSIDLSNNIIPLLKNIKEITNTSLCLLYIPLVNRHWSSEKDIKLLNEDLEYILTTKKIFINDVDRSNKYHYISPLFSNGKIVAYLCFGRKNNDGYFTLEELTKLEGLIKILAIASNRYILYLKQKAFNITLKNEIKNATKLLEEKNRKLAEKMEFERDMLDILGHELRTPLGIARNAVFLINKLLVNKKIDLKLIKKYNNMAVENIQREVDLLETLLSATKIDNNKLQLTLTKVDLNDVVNDSLDGLYHKAKGKNIEVIFNSDKDYYVEADRTRIQEISDNLIDNAIKYTHKGEVSITLSSIENEVKLEIKDSGVGIPKEDIPKLGQKFFRVDNYLSKEKNADELKIVRPGGTGLGLYVTFSLIKSMNGRITVTSEVNKGSTFSVYFKKL